MKRILVVSDIHGYCSLFKELLDKSRYNPSNDLLVLLGDYIDRGPASKETVEFVMELVANGAVALTGNHEYQLIQAYDTMGEAECSLFFKYGGRECVKSYGFVPEFSNIRRVPEEHIDFLRTLPYYCETDEYVFVHGGLDTKGQAPNLTGKLDLLYARENWLSSPYWGKKTVIFGHTPTHHIHGHQKETFWIQGNRVGIDLGVYETGCLGLLQLPDFGVYRVKL